VGLVDAILARCVGGVLPAGFVQVVASVQTTDVTGQVGKDILSWACAEELGAVGIYPLGADYSLFASRGRVMTLLTIAGEQVMGALVDLLECGLFRVVVIDPFDAVGPDSEKWGVVSRAAWLRRTLPQLRGAVHKAGATVFLVCHLPGGSGVVKVWSALVVRLQRNSRGVILSVEGKDSVPGNAPFLLLDWGKE
jgi:hypothetical protein